MYDKKFFKLFAAVSMATLIVMGIFVFLWDPCNYYRINNNELKYVASTYIDAGVIKNADYDAAVIGSSLSQNFDPQLFRELLGDNVLKVNTGGISLEQRDLFYNCLENTGKTHKYYVEILISSFNAEDDILDDTPIYLYDENPFNDYKYLYGYETWLRAIPISLAYRLLDTCGVQLDSMYNLKSVDNIGSWFYRHEIGADIVIRKYMAGEDTVTVQNKDGMHNRMITNIDKKLASIIEDDNSYIFFFPPYSALYWYHCYKEGYLDEWLLMKKYIISSLLKYPNVQIYDFQYADFITDLNNYRDITHYKKEINDWIVTCFASNEYSVKADTYSDNIDKIKDIVISFQEENKSWLTSGYSCALKVFKKQ